MHSAIRARYSLAGMRSKRRRTPAESAVLDAHGSRALVFELQGDLRFATLEPVSRAMVDAGDSVELVVLDFRRVDHVDIGATRLLAGLASRGQALNQHLVLSRVRRGDLLAGLDGVLEPRTASHVHFVPQLDAALEWCEHMLLKGRATSTVSVPEGDLSQHSLCAGLSAADLAALQAYLQRHEHEAGDVLVRRGDPASAIYLITAGEVSVLADVPDGSRRRLATLQFGMSFGESALVEGGLRSADVRADTNVTCWSLSTNDFTRLKAANPALALVLLHNILRSARETILRLTREVAVQDTA
jgi:glutaminase